MNNYQEAFLKILSTFNNMQLGINTHNTKEIAECFDTIQKLIDKKMPKKPNCVTVYNDDDVPAYDILTCPACGFNVEEDIKLNFLLKCCPYCGQSLDISSILDVFDDDDERIDYRKIENLTIKDVVINCKSCDDCSKCEIKELCNIEFCNLSEKNLNKKVKVLK